MLLRIAICDDEIKDTEHIRSFLEQYEMQYDIDFEVTVFNLPEDMLGSYLASGTFHLAFLDVEMPKMNGIKLAEELRALNDKELKIIFVSNYPRYMQDSFPVHPVNYLTKPLTYHDFTKVIGQVLKEMEASHIYKTLIKTDGGEEFINIYDILYMKTVKSRKDMLTFYMKDHFFETVGILKHWEEELKPYHFVSPHRGILLNLNFIHFLKEDTIILHDGTVLPLSRRKSRELHKLLSRQLITFERN